MKDLPDVPYLSERSSGKIHCKICNQDLDRRGVDAHLGGRPHQQRVALMTDNYRKDLLKPSEENPADSKGKPAPSDTSTFSQEAVGAFISTASLEELLEGEQLMLTGVQRIRLEIAKRLDSLGLRRLKPTGVNAPSHVE